MRHESAPTPDVPSSDATPSPAGRRAFVQTMLASGASLAAAGALGACASGAQQAAAAPVPAPRAGTRWDMSWMKKLGRYKTAYDSPEIMNGAALAFAAAASAGYRDAFGVTDAEITPVLILRHAASVMVLNDSMWERLALGEARTLKDPTTGEPAKRNPFINYTKGDKHTMIGAEAGLDVLIAKGAIALACNNGLLGAAFQLAKKEPTFTRETALAEIHRNVIPGAYVMPNGIFAVSAAQDAGCHYMRVLV